MTWHKRSCWHCGLATHAVPGIPSQQRTCENQAKGCKTSCHLSTAPSRIAAEPELPQEAAHKQSIAVQRPNAHKLRNHHHRMQHISLNVITVETQITHGKHACLETAVSMHTQGHPQGALWQWRRRTLLGKHALCRHMSRHPALQASQAHTENTNWCATWVVTAHMHLVGAGC
jgi:hypothetical protein